MDSSGYCMADSLIWTIPFQLLGFRCKAFGVNRGLQLMIQTRVYKFPAIVLSRQACNLSSLSLASVFHDLLPSINTTSKTLMIKINVIYYVIQMVIFLGSPGL